MSSSLFITQAAALPLSRDQLRSGAVVIMLPLAGLLMLTVPLALAWYVIIMTVVCGVATSGATRQLPLAPLAPEAKAFLVFLTVFWLWAVLRTIFSQNLDDGSFAMLGFTVPLVATLIGAHFLIRYEPSGGWAWKFYPLVLTALGLIGTATIAYVIYRQTLQAPTLRHHNLYHYNRGAVFLTLLLPLGWYAINKMQVSVQTKTLWRLAMVGAVTSAVGISESETAKLVLLVVPLVYIAMWIAQRATTYMIAVGAFLFMLIGPFVIHKLLFQVVRFVPLLWEFRPGTFAERVLVWEANHGMIMQAPILGNGVEYYRTFGGEHPLTKANFTHMHSHSFVVQTWLDLGAVGAVLLGLTLAAGILATRRLPRAEAAMLVTTMIGMVTVWAVSHGMWQAWYIGACGVILMSCTIAIRRGLLEGRGAIAFWR